MTMTTMPTGAAAALIATRATAPGRGRAHPDIDDGTALASARRVRIADPEEGPLDDIVDVHSFLLGDDHYCLGDDPDCLGDDPDCLGDDPDCLGDDPDCLGDDLGAWTRCGRRLATALARDGVATLPGFLAPGAVADIAAELDRAVPYANVAHDRRTVHARTDRPDSPGATGHPALTAESDWVAGHVTRDMIPAHSPAHRLYVSPLFKRLIAAAVGVDCVYEYADPLAGLVATVLPPGGCYGWHYDTNEYVVTVTIRNAERGGDFEFHRDLRRPGDENLDGLLEVLDGRAAPGSRSNARPGDLQIFRGRYSLHRVTEVGGESDRLTLVLSYAERPGLIGPADRTRRVYGRVTEAHLVADQLRLGADGLIW